MEEGVHFIPVGQICNNRNGRNDLVSCAFWRLTDILATCPVDKQLRLGVLKMLDAQTTAIVVLSLFILFPISSCTSKKTPVDIASNIEYQRLGVVDSIGREFGDSLQMLGVITDAAHHPSGGILVLDGSVNELRLYRTPEDAEVIASSGSGPSQLLEANCMAVCGSRIVVADKGKHRLLSYNLEGQYLDGDLPFGRFVPTTLVGREGRDFVAVLPSLEAGENGSPVFTMTMGVFSDSAVPRDTCYYRRWSPPFDEVYILSEVFDATTGIAGPTYICEDNTKYQIDIRSVSGDPIGEVLLQGAPRLPKTQEEIQSDIEEMNESHRGDYFYEGDIPPPSHHRLIDLSGVDSLGRLWVRNFAAEDSLHFDIWNHEGKMVARAGVPWPDSRPPVIASVDKGGLLLYTNQQADIVRLYMVSYAEARQVPSN